MLTTDELRDLLRPFYSDERCLEMALPLDIEMLRLIEHEAYKRAAAECRRLGGHPIWIASAYHCAEAIEALGREA